MPLEIDAGDQGLSETDVFRLPERAPQWVRDVGWIKESCRYLIEQGCEEVIVMAIEEKDAGVGAIEGARARQAPEASADDDDALLSRHASILMPGSRCGLIEPRG
jgi:hypothetical protein